MSKVKAHHHAKKDDDTVTRLCMKCRKPFPSTWIGNRLCANCATYGGVGVPKFKAEAG